MDLQCELFHKLIRHTHYESGKLIYAHTLCTRCDVEEIGIEYIMYFLTDDKSYLKMVL